MVRSKHVDGPSEIEFILTIELNSTELLPGLHNITISLSVANFSDAISLTDTVVKLSIRGDIEYYSTYVNMGFFTTADSSATTNTTFMFQDYWGPVTLYLEVEYVVNRASTTSRTLDTGWVEFVDLTTFIDDPYEDPYEDPLPWGVFIALIVIGILSLLGTIIFFSYRFYMKPTPDYVPQPKQQLVEKSSFKPIIEKQETIKKLKQEKTIPLIGEYCSYCGYKADPKSKFCISCGKTLERK